MTRLLRRLAGKEVEEPRLPPGVFLAGSAYHGIGLPDCVRSGARAAREVAQHLRDG